MRNPLSRIALFSAVCAAFAGFLIYAQQVQPGGAKMADQANKLLAGLDAEQRKAATFALDDPHRAAWWFTPQQKDRQSTRKGLRLDKMNADQKAGVLELLKLGLSAKGYEQATTIMSLEALLKELEQDKGANVRNPNWYFLSVFGEPNNTGTWGWRVEGHHLSVNVTLDKGEVVSATPMLFGVNPADIKDGPKKGLRVTPEIEDVAKELIASMTEAQNTTAKLAKQLPEINEGKAEAGVGAPIGVPASELTADQRKTLRKLIEAYATRLPADVAAGEMKKADASFDKVHFAYCVEANKPGKPYTYRVQGPSFVIEFLNVQADAAKNPANHIHSGWRSLPRDFAK
jgi:hypothetical protein